LIDHPWLLCPGLCGIGLAGIGIFATNIQVIRINVNLISNYNSNTIAVKPSLAHG